MAYPHKSLVDGLDPYAISPGSLTLSNKLDISDAIELSQCELVFTAFRRQQGIPSGNYCWDHLKSIHQHLFQDVYEWAGSARATPLNANDGREYLSPDKIDTAMKAIFSELENDSFLLGLNEEQFIDKAAYYYNRMNLVHPFRTGNGRAVRTFIEALALNNGLTLDWKQINRQQWQKASVTAADGDRKSLLSCFSAVVKEQRLGQLTDNSTNMTAREASRAAERAIGLIKGCIQSGKGLGTTFNADDVADIPDKSPGPSMD